MEPNLISSLGRTYYISQFISISSVVTFACQLFFRGGGAQKLLLEASVVACLLLQYTGVELDQISLKKKTLQKCDCTLKSMYSTYSRTPIHHSTLSTKHLLVRTYYVL